jgi:nitrile hydratase subunit beta
MNGIHDMGGMHGFGPIVREENEPLWHASWEARMFALASALSAWGRWPIDASRAQIESMSAEEYLRSAYLGGCEFRRFLN